MPNILGNAHSILNQFIAGLRDENAQRNPELFRMRLERLGELFAYEISKTLDYQEEEVITPLGVARIPLLKAFPVLATIFRAGLPMHKGMQNMFPEAESAFISAFRKINKGGSHEIFIEYISCPDINGKVVILVDPMLATGNSVITAYKELLRQGDPAHIHIATVIASTEGIDNLKRTLPRQKLSIWTGAIDEELTALGYIVPGLGDAGDLAYGKKIQ